MTTWQMEELPIPHSGIAGGYLIFKKKNGLSFIVPFAPGVTGLGRGEL
jgi:hypothetical protein